MSVLNRAEASALLVLSVTAQWIHSYSHADVDPIAAIIEAATGTQKELVPWKSFLWIFLSTSVFPASEEEREMRRK